MKLTVPHWVLVLVALLGAVAPQVGQAFPQLAPAAAVVAQLCTLVVGALGLVTGSAIAAKPPGPPSPPKVAGFVGILCLALALPSLGCAQVQAVFPTLQAIEQVVADDLAAGKSDAQMASDVCAALGGSATTDAVCADVEIVVADVVTVLLDSHVLGEPAASNAKAYQARASARVR